MLFALASSLIYGVSDFAGGIAARRTGVLVAAAVTYLMATVVLAFALLIVPGVWSAGALVTGSVAGLAAVVGFVAFYAALSVGPISLMSPSIALLQSVVPVAFGAVLVGEHLTALGWTGVVVALAAGVLLGMSASGGRARMGMRALLFALVSGSLLGVSVIALHAAPADAGVVPVFVEVAVGLVLLAAVLVAIRLLPRVRAWAAVLESDPSGSGDGGPHPGGRSRGWQTWLADRSGLLLGGLAGALAGVANALLMTALRQDALAVVAVLLGLYPLGTVLLARLVLGERLTARQTLGVGFAIAGSVLLGLG